MPISSESGPVLRFDAVSELRRLLGGFEGFRPAARARAKTELGRRLATIVGRERGAFSPAYLENVVAGRQDPGAPLVRALRALWMARNGGSPIAGAFEPIEVRSRGDVEPGALILGRSVRCDVCGIPFVGAPHQRTCSSICKRKKDVAERAKKRKEESR